MRCFYTNANSLLGKFEEFKCRVSAYDIVGVVETWASSKICDAELAMEGFCMHRKDRTDMPGGGLVLYVKDSLQSTEVDSFGDIDFEESVWCRLSTVKDSLLVGLCYRSPSSPTTNDDRLLELLEAAVNDKKSSMILIMGDFNYRNIDYVSHMVMSGDDSAESRFFNKTNDLFLVQHVTEATRFRQGQRASVLDYIFTNEDNIVDNIHYQEPLGKSDHCCLSWAITVCKEESIQATNKLNYWRGDYETIRKRLGEVNWSTDLAACDNVEDKWVYFKGKVMDLVNEYVPKKKPFRPIKKNEWISRITIKRMKCRHNAWKKYRNLPSTHNFDEFKRLRNEVTASVRLDQNTYRKKLLKSFKSNPKKFYGYMRSRQTVKTKVTTLKTPDGELTQTDEETAELLSTQFQSVFVDEGLDPVSDVVESLIDVHSTKETDSQSIKVTFTTEQIRNKLMKLQDNKSSGPDGFHPMVMKQCADELAAPLCAIYQASYDSGQLPNDWKLANISAIFKKGNKQDPGNYRPVSLTSVPGKVMESIIKEHVVEYLNYKKWLSASQHGFVKGRSCLTNLLEAFEAWTRLLDEGHGIDVIFLDYQKAFDTVPHRRLLVKLVQLGITGKLLKWLKSFLFGRYMRVGIHDAFSQWIKMLSGVPQGSVLGPLLFLIFVNELPEWIATSMKMFADDTKIWTVIDKGEDSKILQEDLDKLVRWSETWLLKFNVEKCKVMHIGHSHPTKYVMTMDQVQYPLNEVQEEKDLGILVSNDLKPSKQCALAAKKAMSMLGLVRRTFQKIDVCDFRILYNCYVRPHLEYCIQVWSPHLVKDIQCLEKVQARATKLVHGLKKLSYSERLDRLGLYSLERRRLRGDLIEMYKILTGKEDVDCQQFFRPARDHYGLRGHSLKLHVIRSRLNCRKYFFSQRSVGEWNRLPQEVVDAPSVNVFKIRLDKIWTDVST